MKYIYIFICTFYSLLYSKLKLYTFHPLAASYTVVILPLSTTSFHQLLHCLQKLSTLKMAFSGKPLSPSSSLPPSRSAASQLRHVPSSFTSLSLYPPLSPCSALLMAATAAVRTSGDRQRWDDNALCIPVLATFLIVIRKVKRQQQQQQREKHEIKRTLTPLCPLPPSLLNPRSAKHAKIIWTF